MDDSRLQRLFDFLRFPSVSTQPEHSSDVEACANWLVEQLQGGGFEARVESTGGAPAVIAKNAHVSGRPTVLIYGHYDVQPPDPLNEWDSEPFSPEVREGRIFARGATDNKGQIMTHIEGVLGMEEIPLNIIFLIEGEEEIGSPNLKGLLDSHCEELACDVVLISDTSMVASNYPTLTYGLRGVAALEVAVHGPSHDLHSGLFGGAVVNPAMALSKMLASLHDESGRVAADGFYDNVQDLNDWEKEIMSGLPLTDSSIRSLSGAPELDGEQGYTAVERICARPTAEINGLWSGYQGAGTKTVLPASAFAKLTFRTVPNQQAGDVVASVMRHLEKVKPVGVTLEMSVGHSGEAYLLNPNSRAGEAVRKALFKVFGKEPALLREGGSIPIVPTFAEVLGVDSLLVAFGDPDSRLHSPNENFPIQNYLTGQEVSRAILGELARAL